MAKSKELTQCNTHFKIKGLLYKYLKNKRNMVIQMLRDIPPAHKQLKKPRGLMLL